MSTGHRRIGKYELHEILGRGGMAEVWKAFDPFLQRYVAIKILHADLQSDTDFIKRFEREARVIASLRHPHIVQVHDFQLVDPSDSGNARAYMVMKYIEGPTLTEYIRRTSRGGNFLPATELIHLFTSVGAAVDYAHQHGMIHRDIKPSNIMLDKRARSRYQIGEPILTDFGIVKLIGASTGTLSGWWMGTPNYISPEQAQGHQGNERSDIYSLSVILYEICTGVRPFLGDTPISVIMQHMSAIPTAPELINPKISPALSEVIMRGLAKDPDERFPSASVLALAIAQALNTSLPISLNSTPPTVGNTPIQANMTPVFPANTLSSPSPAALSTPQFVTSSDSGSRASITPPDASPVGSIVGIPSRETSFQDSPSLTPSSLPPQLSPVPAFEQLRRSRRYQAILIALFVVLLVGSNIATFFITSSLNTGSTSTVGQAYFVSSEPGSSNSTQGINDELQIDLHDIDSPAPGNSYYAWLLNDEGLSSIVPVFLGALTVNNGVVHFLYPGDTTNLINNNSRFVITEGRANSLPDQSTISDQSTWRYYGTLLTSSTNNLYTVTPLQALRNLLFQSSDLSNIEVQGSLDMGFYQNARQLVQLARSALDSYNSKTPNTIHTQVIDILNYLVGTSNVQTEVGTTSPLPLTDSTLNPIKVSLLTPTFTQTSVSYSDLIAKQMNYISAASNITTDTSILVQQIGRVLNNIDTIWLKQVRQDADLLARMDTTQLLSLPTQSILERLESEAGKAFYGYLDTSSGNVQEGVAWIHENIQRLTVFNVSKV